MTGLWDSKVAFKNRVSSANTTEHEEVVLIDTFYQKNRCVLWSFEANL